MAILEGKRGDCLAYVIDDWVRVIVLVSYDVSVVELILSEIIYQIRW